MALAILCGMLIDCDVLALLLDKHRRADERRLALPRESEAYERAVEDVDRIGRVIDKVARRAADLVGQ